MCQYFECSCKFVSICFTVVWCIAAILTAVLVSVSVGVIELNTIGLKFDSVNYALDNNTIYFPGRYWLALGTNLVKFQTTWTPISFSNSSTSIILATTSDPANIYIEAKLMYRIRPEFAHNFYALFPNNDPAWFYKNLASNVIQNIAQNYSVYDFMNLRRNISQVFANNINIAFRNNFAEIMTFQLGQISFDDVYEQFILKQAITRNELNLYLLNGQLSEINANISILNSQTDLIINQIYSQAYQNSSVTINNAISNGDLNITLSQAEALRIFVSTAGLNFTSQELNKFLLYDKLNDLSGFYSSSSNNFTFNFGGINEYYK